MGTLKDFMVGLAIDPLKLGSFIHDPEKAMKDAELSEEDKIALRSGFAMVIHARLSGLSIKEAFEITLHEYKGANYPPVERGKSQRPMIRGGSERPAKSPVKSQQFCAAMFQPPSAQWPPPYPWSLYPPPYWWGAPVEQPARKRKTRKVTTTKRATKRKTPKVRITKRVRKR